MSKQIMVIGLGLFGTSLARSLADKGAEVMAVDANAERVRRVVDYVAEAVNFDATDEEALARAAPQRRDVCVCAIGSDSKEDSIICTALLRQMGARRIVARANDPLHERILRLVGAHEVVNPERDFGDRMASRIVYEGIISEMPLGEDLVVTELAVPQPFVGRSLIDLNLIKQHGITVVAYRKKGESGVFMPDPHVPLAADNVLIVVSRRGAVGRMMEKGVK